VEVAPQEANRTRKNAFHPHPKLRVRNRRHGSQPNHQEHQDDERGAAFFILDNRFIKIKTTGRDRMSANTTDQLPTESYPPTGS
jgi:hypothetical protein